MPFVFFALIRAVFTMPQKMDTPALGRRKDLFSYVADAAASAYRIVSIFLRKRRCNDRCKTLPSEVYYLYS